jgi:hypothetical protein
VQWREALANPRPRNRGGFRAAPSPANLERVVRRRDNATEFTVQNWAEGLTTQRLLPTRVLPSEEKHR